ncbi:GntR family transcriptional regulator [Kaistia sp. 32K]|uniref:GntR family transcriptional regulator n=1 Tax=Kaistia sp. 32K TaxID=2795690 RepID=UPI00191629BA|nr:GntR family transcriptional regulator [Kaistia sp. 32K]BCP52216.1 GntR family transcriptional regulator [Kaistia sp. 32K]
MRTLSVSEQIAQQIGAMIIAGEYEPGARLVEEQISADFGVSRNPVREAFRIMERDGFVSISARRGAQVVSLTPEEARDLFEIEGQLYALMARRLAEASSREALELLDEAVRLLEESLAAEAPLVDFLVAINQLSLDLAALSGNNSLPHVMSLVLIRNLGFTRSSLTCANRKGRLIAGWRRMRDAIEAANVSEAEKAARDIVAELASAVIKIILQAAAPAH